MSDSISIIRLPSVRQRTGLSRSAIYERMKSGDFPQRIKLGARASGWVESEVLGWIQSRIRTSRAA